mmetsp:Transcript_4035/g.6388  ORF Transcript_4035/g.6388 Transcript_4035/m.6388 type:complete len:229 (-) Transcript_4035:69-755(-)
MPTASSISPSSPAAIAVLLESPESKETEGSEDPSEPLGKRAPGGGRVPLVPPDPLAGRDTRDREAPWDSQELPEDLAPGEHVVCRVSLAARDPEDPTETLDCPGATVGMDPTDLGATLELLAVLARPVPLATRGVKDPGVTPDLVAEGVSRAPGELLELKELLVPQDPGVSMPNQGFQRLICHPGTSYEYCFGYPTPSVAWLGLQRGCQGLGNGTQQTVRILRKPGAL